MWQFIMVKIHMKGFRAVEFKRGDLILKRGGLLNREVPLTTKEIRSSEGGPTATFIKIASRESWLGAATMGKVNRGDMFLGVLVDLHDRVRDMEKRVRLGLPALEDTEPKDADPMDEMGDFEIPDLHNNQPKRSNRKQTLRSPGLHSQYA